VQLPQPYLLFLGDVTEPTYAKTAFGLRDWARQHCVGEWSCSDRTVTLGLPRLSPAQAHASGARSTVIGVANIGGKIVDSWVPHLLRALEAGLDVVSGMHARLADTPALKAAAERHKRRLIDVRTPPMDIPIANGRKRTGKRLLTVGTDCALGKKYTALTIARALKLRGVDADFRATGQTGIMIAGAGMPMDAVVSDFVAGAAEMLSPDASADHWDVIEGQGSLFHPSYAGVSLGLLHGSQPDVIVVCHEPGRRHLIGHPELAVPSIEETIELNLAMGRRTNVGIRCGGVSLNTSQMREEEARRVMEREERRLQMPVADPVRGGEELGRLVEECLRG
jgi:D-glutamate N-acetyltransferase